MRLETYLVTHEITPTSFAEQLNCPPADIRSILAGNQPTRQLAEHIEKLTHGNVLAEELVYHPASGPIGLAPVRDEIERSKQRKRRI